MDQYDWFSVVKYELNGKTHITFSRVPNFSGKNVDDPALQARLNYLNVTKLLAHPGITRHPPVSAEHDSNGWYGQEIPNLDFMADTYYTLEF